MAQDQTVAQRFPAIVINLGRIEDENVRHSLRDIIRAMELVRNYLAESIAHNQMLYIAQDAQPTPSEGEWMIWKDTNATAGQPKAYIVTQQDSVVYTFASEETV
jgi:dihydroxyacid dehydratase/phosphogluconate dehydratase